MRRLPLGIFSFLFLTILLFIPFKQVHAQSTDTTKPVKTVVLDKNQTVNSDYFATGDSVDIAGTVNGDVFVAAGNLRVDGVINGDLVAAAGVVHISGTVANNVRVVGGNIFLSGIVGRNISIAGGTIDVSESAKIAGTALIAGGMVTLDSPIEKDLRIAAGQVGISNTVKGNAYIYDSQLLITSRARILGDLRYWSEQKANIQSNAAISGRVIHSMPQKIATEVVAPKTNTSNLISFGIIMELLFIGGTFLVGLIFIIFFPSYLEKLTRETKKNVMNNFGMGILTIIITPIIIVLLFISVIGIPLGILIGILFGYTIYAAKIIAALIIGEMILILFKKKNVFVALIIGLIVYQLLSLIPILGWLFSLIVISIAFGAIIKERKHNYNQLRASHLL